jgi:Na+-transporting NADH:ubiquinone oxidoreductase subunit F
VLEGGGPVLPTELPYLSEEEIGKNVRLSCQVKVKNDIRIRVPDELLAVKEYRTTVERIEELTHDIRGLRFRLPEGERVRFRAGQYVNLVCPPYGELKEKTSRAYSIASVPSDDEAIELIIRLVPNGICTTWVFEHLREGDEATLIGPFGDFFLRETDRQIICIAGGSGLAPIQSIVLDMIERGVDHRVTTFFFGAVKERDLYYVDRFESIAAEHDWFTFLPALSGPEGQTKYETGLITDVVDRHYDDLSDHEAYLCGSPGMIDACIKVLTGNGMPEERIFYDKFA